MAEANWYVIHTYSGYENKVKANIEKTVGNRHLENEILDVRVPLEDVQETKNGVTKIVQRPKIVGDFEVGDTVVVIAGAWEGTEGAVTGVNAQKQTVTISVELFGRATPVEISFAEVKKR